MSHKSEIREEASELSQLSGMDEPLVITRQSSRGKFDFPRQETRKHKGPNTVKNSRKNSRLDSRKSSVLEQSEKVPGISKQSSIESFWRSSIDSKEGQKADGRQLDTMKRTMTLAHKTELKRVQVAAEYVAV